MPTETFGAGQRVLVTFPDSEHRDDRNAVVVEQNDDGTVLVEYPGSSPDGRTLFGNIRESVPVERIEVR